MSTGRAEEPHKEAIGRKSSTEEMKELIGSNHGEHNRERTTYRNGFYLNGDFLPIEDI